MQLSNYLADLAERIGEQARRSERGRLEWIAGQLEAGRLLMEAKAEAGHGQWRAVLDRAGVNERTARRMTRLARSGMDPERIAALGGPRPALDSLQKRKTDRRSDLDAERALNDIVSLSRRIAEGDRALAEAREKHGTAEGRIVIEDAKIDAIDRRLAELKAEMGEEAFNAMMA